MRRMAMSPPHKYCCTSFGFYSSPTATVFSLLELQSLQLLIPPRTPMFQGFQRKKVGVPINAVGMPRRTCQHTCATISFGYAWEQLGSKKPVDDGACETIRFEPRRVIHLWLGQAERNANKMPSEAR